MSPTITILPETGGPALCVALRGVITAEDFTRFFETPLRLNIEKHGYYNVCVIYQDDFEGWSEEAADLSFKCISEISPRAKKAAYVNAPDSRHLLMKMVKPLSEVEVRYFDEDQRNEALDWVKE